jgi:photosystem II stability/assembly factor-like uncharacterized protein
MGSIFISGNNAIAVSSNNSTTKGLYYSLDAGASWNISNISNVFVNHYVNDCLYIQGSNALAMISNFGGYYSTDLGKTWTLVTGLEPDLFYSVKMMNNYAIVGGQTLGQFSNDSGVTWTLFTGVSGSAFYKVDVNASGQAVAFSSMRGYYSTNYGASWNASTFSPMPNNTYATTGALNSSGKAICGIYANGIYYSSDGGANFVQTNVTTGGGNPNNITMDGENCIAISGSNTLWYSTNGGASWTNTSVSSSGPALCISGNYAINNGTKYSTNNGQSWLSSSTPHNSLQGAVVINGQRAIMSDNTQLYYSTDGGNNWSSPTIGVPPVICFKEGTKILYLNPITKQEEYIQIELLRRGDLVKTVSSGLQKIEDIGYSKFYNNVNDIRSTNKLYKCSKSEYNDIFEDLTITGCHCILKQDFKDKEEREQTQKVLGKIYVTDGYYRLPACVDKNASIYQEEGVHTIWHFSLENTNYYGNYGVFANGLLVETCSKRTMKELSGMTLL